MNSEASSTQSQTRSRKGQLLWVLRLVLGLAVVGVLIAWQSEGVRRALERASWPLLLGAVAFYLSTQLLSALKWQLLLNAALRAQNPDELHEATSTRPAPLTWLECYRIYLIGMFWNLFMPTSIGGDAMRAFLAGRRTGNLPLAASSILTERLTGFIALILIGTIGMTVQIGAARTGEAGGNRAGSTLLLALGLLATFALLVLIARSFAYRLETKLHSASTPETEHGLQGKVLRLWIRLHRALDVYGLPSTRGTLALAVVMSLMFQSTQILLNYYLARGVGLDLPIETFLWLVPSLAIASMIPLGIGGLGVREAAAVALIAGSVGTASPGTIIAWSLLGQATLWLSALPGAVAHAMRRD